MCKGKHKWATIHFHSTGVVVVACRRCNKEK